MALKLAWPGVLMDPVASRRFIEEPKTVASLKHRGIVEVYDSGEIEMASFIALELIDGPTLAQWLKEEEHVSARLAAHIVCDVSEAIHVAHERDIVHRDLKPSNILLRPSADGAVFAYEPVVTDFGLARRPRLSETSMLTGTQAILGTDRYMSPEQAAGRQDEVGRGSDVFSLGVIFYELLARRLPFDGDSSEQVRWRIQHDDAPAIRAWRSGVPKDLETIALKCLEKEPARRYPTSQALSDDLRRWLRGESIHARPLGRAGAAGDGACEIPSWQVWRRLSCCCSCLGLRDRAFSHLGQGPNAIGQAKMPPRLFAKPRSVAVCTTRPIYSSQARSGKANEVWRGRPMSYFAPMFPHRVNKIFVNSPGGCSGGNCVAARKPGWVSTIR